MIHSVNFQNEIMTSIFSLCTDFYHAAPRLDLVAISTAQLARVFQNTLPTAALRKFILNHFVASVDIEEWLRANAGSVELHEPDLGFFEGVLRLAVPVARNNALAGCEVDGGIRSRRCSREMFFFLSLFVVLWRAVLMML